MSPLKNLIRPSDSIETALRVIDANAGKIALVVDPGGRLLGTVSDGDARRALLRGLTLGSPVEGVMNRHPATVSPEADRDEARRMMRERVLRHLPVVDAAGKVVALRALEDLVAPEPRENWVVILAGGEGRRLRPLTEACPKPMLRLGDKPLLECTISRLKGMGFGHFLLSVNYLAEAITGHFGDGSAFGVEIRYLREAEPLGTAGPLSLLPETPRLPIVVMNGDILTQLDLSSMLDFHVESGSLATMGVREFEIQLPYGVVNVEEMRIIGIDEKPIQRHLISAGIYVLSPEAVEMVPPGLRMEMPDLFLEARRRFANVSAYLIREYWIDIGQIDDLGRARRDFHQMFPGGVMPRNVLALIPARGGSKGLPGKNILLLAGKPLIAYSISAAQALRPPLRKILVSTDDPAIALVARERGASVPFLRPAELATDAASSIGVAQHALNWVRNNEGWQPDWVLLLQPTSPLRTAQDVETVLSIAENSPCDSVIAVTPLLHAHPWYAKQIAGDLLQPFLADAPLSFRRQDIEPAYLVNGAVYLTRSETIDSGSFFGATCRPYIMPPERAVDIDSRFDLRLAAMLLDGADHGTAP